MTILLILTISIGWCFLCTFIGINRIYIYIWFATLNIEGMSAIIFCEIVGGAIDLAKLHLPLMRYEEENEIYKGTIWLDDDLELIHLYTYIYGLIVIAALILSFFLIKISPLVWDLQYLSILYFLYIWGMYIYKEKRLLTHLVVMVFSLFLVLTSLKFFNSGNSILIYTTVVYQLCFPYIYRGNTTKTKKLVPQIQIKEKKKYIIASNKTNDWFTAGGVTGLISSNFIGINKVLLLESMREDINDNDNDEKNYHYHEYLLSKVVTSSLSLIYAIYSTGTKDASANYISLIIREYNSLNHMTIILLILWMGVCILISKQTFLYMRNFLYKQERLYYKLNKSYTQLGVLATIVSLTCLQENLLYIVLMILGNVILLRYIKKNKIRPILSGVGLEVLPFLGLFKLI